MKTDRIDVIEMPPEGISRRRFLALLGASAAFASGAGSCSKVDRGTIVPYTRRPREIVPGLANHYASTFTEGLTPYSVLVSTREGRPIHVEGNDEHPYFRGKTSLRAIADVLRLYDPDRLRQPLLDGQPATWEQAEVRAVAALRGAKDQGTAILLLTAPVISPTRRALIEDLKEVLPRLTHIAFEPLAPFAERASAAAVFGEPLTARHRFDRADVVLALGDDFLGAGANAPVAVREFTERRRVRRRGESMNRLWVIEGSMTLTGAKADHRFAVRPSRVAACAFALARQLHEQHGIALPAGLDADRLEAFGLDAAAGDGGVPVAALHSLATDLARAGRAGLVVAGSDVPAEAHTAAHLLNVMLGAEGHTVETARAPSPVEVATPEEFGRTLSEMKAGRFAAAVLWGVNPAYWVSDRGLWAEALKGVSTRIFIGLQPDETARDCQVVFPEHHWLEAWGDYESATNLLSLQQPAMGPLHDTKQAEEVLLRMAGALGSAVPGDYHEYLKARWQREVLPAGSPVSFEQFWSAALHDGVLVQGDGERLRRDLRVGAVAEAMTKAASPSQGLELILRPGTAVYDGRYGNNGWLQELPDPITKATWSNPLSVSPADARRLSLLDGDVVRLDAGGRSVEIPVVVQRGQAPGVVSGALGYGRDALSVARQVGVSLYPLIEARGSSPTIRVGAEISPTGRRVELPLTQTHHEMEGRDIVRSFTLAEYAAGHEHKEHDLASLYHEVEYPEHKWGMAIDLSACVGCAGCVIACQSENNVPTVGPEQVLKGREMHWIRIDRYYEGDQESPQVLYQPMLCQQCDNAPCENVCPVNATSHSPDGLNQMAYNRCVGTRYCANNCPYKVRRFNFFEFTAKSTEVEQLAYNPEVTVRPRGVMEKCTFCVQRIQDVRQRAKAEKRDVRDGEIKPACAAACPAEAIVFGDLKDAKSAVSRLSKNDRGYHVLAELGVRPAVTYLANLSNPVDGNKKHDS